MLVRSFQIPCSLGTGWSRPTKTSVFSYLFRVIPQQVVTGRTLQAHPSYFRPCRSRRARGQTCPCSARAPCSWVGFPSYRLGLPFWTSLPTWPSCSSSLVPLHRNWLAVLGWRSLLRPLWSKPSRPSWTSSGFHFSPLRLACWFFWRGY